MTWSPVVPGTAQRVLRATAARRAVRLVLLVGAVFVLGVLCGERAQAADGAPVRAGSAEAPVPTGLHTPSEANARRSLADTLTAPRPDAAGPVRPLTEAVVRSVGERVVRPVGELVGTVTEGLDEASGALPAPERAAPLPDIPVVPEAPAPTLPEPTIPGPDQPSFLSLDAPGAPTVRTPAAPEAPPAAEAPDTPGTSDTPRTSGTPDTPAPGAAPALHGPRLTGVGGGEYGRPGDERGRGALAREDLPAGPVLAPYAPAGDRPHGATGTGPAADHCTPRHGDACAVPAFHRPAPRLVPGPTVPGETAGTRDLCRDVPVSPA
ncbi:hypothetical protein BU52_13550 [Streptomyces toyocaensis]|uniref:Uncharacterized protein n=1 Tax=Streptomyces toyocaensis TaxID=55952 RepID=A0A081XTD2_STRTO|nr:hypothetical protein [Streptomyces toyocaensis]KES06805.1 hypothetical protein BU52_13550 [Streptomyces toyocaensis]